MEKEHGTAKKGMKIGSHRTYSRQWPTTTTINFHHLHHTLIPPRPDHGLSPPPHLNTPLLHPCNNTPTLHPSQRGPTHQVIIHHLPFPNTIPQINNNPISPLSLTPTPLPPPSLTPIIQTTTIIPTPHHLTPPLPLHPLHKILSNIVVATITTILRKENTVVVGPEIGIKKRQSHQDGGSILLQLDWEARRWGC